RKRQRRCQVPAPPWSAVAAPPLSKLGVSPELLDDESGNVVAALQGASRRRFQKTRVSPELLDDESGNVVAKCQRRFGVRWQRHRFQKARVSPELLDDESG